MTCVLVTSVCSHHGRHLVRALRERGHEVIGLDGRLHGHSDSGPGAATLTIPADLDLIMSWPADQNSLALALSRADAIIHLIPPVHPMDLDLLQRPPASPSAALTEMITLLRAAVTAGIRRFVLQSSLMVYGEGRYIDEDGQPQPARRMVEDLQAGIWQAKGLRGQPIAAMPTPEDTPTSPLSEAAKLCLLRERMVRIWARATGADVAVLRMGRLYGTPMAGDITVGGEIGLMVAAILRGEPPVLLEDGGQTDDWLYVGDAAHAMCLALTACDRDLPPLNITTGIGHTASEVAALIAREAFGETGEVRPLEMACKGTARHLVGAPGAAENLIGFLPQHSLGPGLSDLIHWTRQAVIPEQALDLMQQLQDAADLIGPGSRSPSDPFSELRSHLH